MKEKQILALLKKHKIPLGLWGAGEAKTLNHLFTEVSAGEATLEESDTGLLRIAFGACLNIFYIDKSGIYKLEEDRQVFKDGRVKKRNLSTSIGEKLKPGENPKRAAYRALSEELGIEAKGKIKLIRQPTMIRGPVPSVSFPGLKTKYIFRVFKIQLPKRFYKPEGYAEIQTDKTSYFVWKKQSHA